MIVAVASEDALARLTSLSVIAPTPRWMTLSWTSSGISILNSASSRASTEPETSPLRTRVSEVFSPSLSCSMSVSSVARPRELAKLAARRRACRCSAICRTVRSSSAARNVSPAPGTDGQTQHQHRTGRTRLGDLLAVLVEHGPDAAVRAARHDRVAGPQRALLHQDGRHRTAALVEVRLDRDTLRRPVDRSGQLQRRVGGQQDGLEQLVDADARLGGHVDEHRVAAVLLGDQAVVGQLLADLVRVGVRLVDLVDRDHDRHVGRLGVVERLDRLRHDAVVGRDHQDHDVGHLGTTGTHGGERLVARGVDEGDRPVVALVRDVRPGRHRCAG